MHSPDSNPRSKPLMPSSAVASFYLAMLFVALVWAAFTEPGLSLITRLPEHGAEGWFAGALVGLSLVLFSMAAEPFVPSLRRLSAEIAHMVAPVTPARVAVLALSSGIAEEALFRGCLQHTVGYVVASILFALLHGGVAKKYIAWSTFALVAGLSFGLLAEHYQSIGPPALAHIVVNAINLARLSRVAPLSDDEGPP